MNTVEIIQILCKGLTGLLRERPLDVSEKRPSRIVCILGGVQLLSKCELRYVQYDALPCSHQDLSTSYSNSLTARARLKQKYALRSCKRLSLDVLKARIHPTMVAARRYVTTSRTDKHLEFCWINSVSKKRPY